MTRLLTLLPSNLMVFGVLAIGIALIVGAITTKRAGQLLGLALALVVAKPFVTTLFHALPWWLLLFIYGFMALSALGTLSRAILGPAATGHVVGALTYDALKMLGKGLAALFRMAWGRRD